MEAVNDTVIVSRSCFNQLQCEVHQAKQAICEIVKEHSPSQLARQLQLQEGECLTLPTDPARYCDDDSRVRIVHHFYFKIAN